MSKGIAASAVFLLALLCVTQAAAQQPERTVTSADARVVFDGGTLDDYVAVVRKQFASANVVVDGVGDIRLPKVHLPRVSLRAALDWIPRTDESSRRGVTLRTPGGGSVADAVFVLSAAQSTAAGRTPASSDVRVRTLALADEEVTRMRVRRAVEIAVAARKSTASVQYNAEAAVLTVVGTAADIEAADQAYQAIPSVLRAEGSLRRLQVDVDQLKTQVRELQQRPGTK